MDGVPLFAVVMPAYWLERRDLHEIVCGIVGRANVRYPAQLVIDNTSQGELDYEVYRPMDLGSGLYFYSTAAYCDANWRPVQEAAGLARRSDQPSASEVDRRFDDLLAGFPPLQLRVGGRAIEVVVSGKPNRNAFPDPPPDDREHNGDEDLHDDGAR